LSFENKGNAFLPRKRTKPSFTCHGFASKGPNLQPGYQLWRLL